MVLIFRNEIFIFLLVDVLWVWFLMLNNIFGRIFFGLFVNSGIKGIMEVF